jgi:hypothetical protein
VTQVLSTTIIASRPSYFVQLKRAWGDEWVTVSHLHPATWSHAHAPQMPQALLIYDVGRIMRANKPAGADPGFEDYAWLPDAARDGHAFLEGKLHGSFVRICAVAPPPQVGQPGVLTQLWIGIVVGDLPSRFGYTDIGEETELPAGHQTIHCVGLEHLLNMKPIDRAYVVNRPKDANGRVIMTPDDTLLLAEIDWIPDFNRTSGHGGPAGNKSAPRLVGDAFALLGNDPARDPDGYLNVFADDGGPTATDPDWGAVQYREQKWSAEDIALYLLYFFQPFGNTAWTLDGTNIPVDVLQFVTTTADHLYGAGVIVRQEGRTVWQLLNELAAPQLGLGWRISCPQADVGAESVASVEFHSKAPSDIAIGASGATLPGNRNKVNLELSGSKRVSQLSIAARDNEKYDEIVVMGERIIVCFSASKADGTLDKDWSDADEAAYLEAAAVLADGTPNTDYADYDDLLKAEINDIVRAQDQFKPVFARFRFPDAWDFKAGDGVGGAQSLVQITCLPNGGVSPYSLGGFQHRWEHGRPLLSLLPLLASTEAKYFDTAAWAYDAVTDEPIAVPGVIPRVRPGTQRRPVAVWVPRQTVQGQTLTEIRWQAAEEQFEGPEGTVAGAEVTPDRSALYVKYPVPHICAANHWSGAEPTQFDPELFGFDWEQMIVTLAVELDQRLSVREVLDYEIPAAERKRMLIEVPEAHLWWVAPRTVIEADADGSLLRVPAETTPTGTPWARGVIRNDVDVLQATAAVAREWYGVRRYDLELAVVSEGVDGLAPFASVMPGAMIEWIDPAGKVGGTARLLVNAVVGQVVYDNTGDELRMSLEAGRTDLDPVVVVGRGVW